MDPYPIDRIRNASFSLAVRGYDRHEVDELLGELVEWLQRDELGAGGEQVRDELARVGEQVAEILVAAHDAGREIREGASVEARQSLAGANVTAETLRADADEYSERLRAEADAYSRELRAEAETVLETARAEAERETAELRVQARTEAERMVDEAARRRRDVEAVISDLEERRNAVLNELDRLASGISGAATAHRPSAPGQQEDRSPHGPKPEPANRASSSEPSA